MSATVWSVTHGQRGTPAMAHFAGSAGAEVAALGHEIIVSDGAVTRDYSALACMLHTKTLAPRGEVEATWEFDTDSPEDWLPNPDSIVTITDIQGRSYHGGIIGRVSCLKQEDGIGHHVKITAYGLETTATWDGYVDSRIWPAATPIHTVFEESRDERTQFIVPFNTEVVHGGEQIGSDLQAIGQAPRQLWDSLSARGDNGVALDWAVYTNHDNAGAYLHLRQRDTQPILKLPISCLGLPLAWDTQRRINKVVVRYALGYVPAQASGSVTRWRYIDAANQIDNLQAAQELAEQALALLNVLEMLTDGALVLNDARPIYDEAGDPFPLWLIRSGWRVQLTDDDLLPILPYVTELPIDMVQIVGTDCDHEAETNSLTLSDFDDPPARHAQYAWRDKQRPNSPVHEPIASTPVSPPPSLPVPVSTSLTPTGANGRLGWDNVAEDADIDGPVYVIDGGDEVITAGRKPDLLISGNHRLLGFRLLAANYETGESPTTGTIEIAVTYAHFASFPALGSAVVTLVLNDAASSLVNLSEDPGGATPIIDVGPDRTLPAGERGPGYLTFEVAEDPAPTLKGASIVVLLQKTEGSDRGGTMETPTIVSVSPATALGVTTFTVTTDRPCTAQIEFGPDANYRSRSQRSEHLRKISTLGVPGIPSGTHYRAHVFDAHGNTASSADQTL